MRLFTPFIFASVLLLLSYSLQAQVTTGSLSGTVADTKASGLTGASIEAVHEPSGTRYRTVSQQGGKFAIPGMRIGGPYKVTITYVGYKTETYDDIYLQLGSATRLDAVLENESKALSEVVVTAGTGRRNRLIGTERKGTATNIGRRTLESLPTLSRSLTDFTKLTPQSRGTSFAGQDDRFNNLTIDGSIFNNSFGLQALPGSQTNATPISLDAIEEIQVNLSPYNVKEGGFTGAGINAVTRSGTNTFHGSVFYNQRNEKLVGKKASGTTVNIVNFDVKQFGFRLGGPIIKNKLFFFINAEAERRRDPGTTFIANNGDAVTESNETRVKQSDLDYLSRFLSDSLRYNAGLYQGYNLETYSNKALAKIDYNISDRSKFSLRFNYLRSYRDVPISNSGGFNGRRDNLFAMNFSNSNYVINNDIYSVIAELNTNISNRFSNNIIVGYTANRDYRSSNSSVFPLVDILEGGRNLISFGYEPFTANNKLNTDTWQFQDNLTFYLKKHTISAGVNFEAFKFFNSFTPTIYGQYVFSSLNDFYRAARSFINTPNAPSPVTLRRYQLTYSALDGRELWAATTRAYQAGVYLQDEFEPADGFTLTAGIRVDVPFFGSTAFRNDSVDAYRFRDENGSLISLSTSTLPKATPLFSPRVGFNWDLFQNRKTQIRGGIGLFSGRPAFVWISNQIGNNGVQSGQLFVDNTTAYAFTTDVTKYIPATVTRPAPSYNIAVTDKNFKFPQVLRTNVAIDHQLPLGIIATVEALFTQSVNNVNYVQANLPVPTQRFNGPDNRPRYTSQRINGKITDATVLKNTNQGYSYNFTVKLERPFRKGFSWMVAFNHGLSEDLMSAGSIAFSSWRDNLSVRGNNYAELSYSNNDQAYRVIGNLSYRKEFFGKTALQVTLFGQSRNQGRFSYTYSDDMNGDGVLGNDLLYVPFNKDAMNFEQWTDDNGTATTADDITYTIQQQKDAFDAYISQDKYLKDRRGAYTKRNGALLPWLTTFDLSVQLEFFKKIGKERHTFQLRGDVFNVGNLISNKWGVADVVNTVAPLRARGVDAAGVPRYRMNTVNRSLNYTTFRNSAALGDVWQAQLGLRYIF